MKSPHPALEYIFGSDNASEDPAGGSYQSGHYAGQSTSLSLAQVLAAGCLARLNPEQSHVSIWDPTAGTGFAGHLLVLALQSAGVTVSYRGQDIQSEAAQAGCARFEGVADAEVSAGDSLLVDNYEGFAADLVLVDGPIAMSWASIEPQVRARQQTGAFAHGLPQRTDSSWLFVSLALEKLRDPSDGGGRVVALLPPSVLSRGGASAEVRKRIVEAGLLESVTRLPNGLLADTNVPLYLVTFSNRPRDVERMKVRVADLQAQFTTVERERQILPSAVRDLESGLRTGKSGPRNRTVDVTQFLRTDARISRSLSGRPNLSWRTTAFRGLPVDQSYLTERYGEHSGVTLDGDPRTSFDLNPKHILENDERAILKALQDLSWQPRRLVSLLHSAPMAMKSTVSDVVEGRLFVPTGHQGKVSAGSPDPAASGRVLALEVNEDLITARFLAAWLNSELGLASRTRAIEAGSSGHHYTAVGSGQASLMRWADELIVPVPDGRTQTLLSTEDERLASFQAELENQRADIWNSPEKAEATVRRYAKVFDNSLDTWLEELPFPVASALRTATTTESTTDRLQSYLRGWEAMAVFHASVLLSASRADPGRSAEVEDEIARTLQSERIGIERASFGTWNVVIEATTSLLRKAVNRRDDDEIAQLRRTFSGLGVKTISRFIDDELTQTFKAVGRNRNDWSGHVGHTSEKEKTKRISSLVASLHKARRILGDFWSQLLLVRAGIVDPTPSGLIQAAEIVVGTSTPFIRDNFEVEQPMIRGELYLTRKGSEAPLPLGGFVTLGPAPESAQFTSYFYSRTEGEETRLITYQDAEASEIRGNAVALREEYPRLFPQPALDNGRSE